MARRWRPKMGDKVRIIGPSAHIGDTQDVGVVGVVSGRDRVSRTWQVDTARYSECGLSGLSYRLSSLAPSDTQVVRTEAGVLVTAPAAASVGEPSPSDVEVVTTPAYGWRSWTLAADGPRPTLVSHYTSTPWAVGVAEASCEVGHRYRRAGLYPPDRSDHGPSPATSCGCGLYARTRLNDLLDTAYWVQGTALGLIEAWGVVVHGENGMRAQYARPVLLVNTWAHNRDLLRACARRYETELVDADPDRASILRTLQGRPGVEIEEPSWTSERPSRWSSTSQPTWLPNSLKALSETLYLPTLLRNSPWATSDDYRVVGS